MLPIAFPKAKMAPAGETILAADVGGTKTNLSLFTIKDGEMQFIREWSYRSAQYPSFVDIVKVFHAGVALPNRICVGFAGPIIRGEAEGTNLAWGISSAKVTQELGIKKVSIINDLEANAYGLAALKNDEVLVLNEGDHDLKGNAAIISPGTGLGEAGLFWDGKGLHPFATEGGHCDFYPRTEIDVELFLYLRTTYEHISWERLLSGAGIFTIYKFLRDVRNYDEPLWMSRKMAQEDPAQVISEAAMASERIALETYQLFLRYLAEESANLALKIKSTGGLFIGGGIVPKILPMLDQRVFLSHFLHSGRLKTLLQKVPVYVILNDKTALWGAAYYGANS